MKDAESTWSSLLSRLPQVREFVDDCDGLAARLAGLADRLDLFVEANAVTLIHGDCKAWNLFFGEERALFIDLQWVGRGHPMQVSQSLLKYLHVVHPSIPSVALACALVSSRPQQQQWQ